MTSLLLFLTGYLLEPGMALVREEDSVVQLYELVRLSSVMYAASTFLFLFSIFYLVVGIGGRVFLAPPKYMEVLPKYFLLMLVVIIILSGYMSYLIADSFYIR